MRDMDLQARKANIDSQFDTQQRVVHGVACLPRACFLTYLGNRCSHFTWVRH